MKRLQLAVFLMLVSIKLCAQTDTLLVGYNPNPPFVSENHHHLSGPSIWLWEQIAEEHDIPYKLIKLPLDSLLHCLAEGEIDLSASPLTITSERLEVMDFSPPYHIAHSSILLRKKTVDIGAVNFITSFLSIDFFKALGALAVVIFVFGFLTWIFERKKNPEEFKSGIKGLWSGFWWSAVTMTTVGYGDKTPRTFGGRMVAMIWMFTAIIIISSFTASIASSLTVDKIGTSVNNIRDFKTKSLGTIEQSATEKWLKDNFFSNKKGYSNIQELTEALKAKKIDAIAYDRPILQNLIKNDSLGNFLLLDIKYNPQFYGIGINRRLPTALKQKINISVMEFTEGMDWKVLLSEYDLK